MTQLHTPLTLKNGKTIKNRFFKGAQITQGNRPDDAYARLYGTWAKGVFASSLFLSSIESRIYQAVKERLVQPNGLDLMLFRTMPAYYRLLSGKLAEKLVAMDKMEQATKNWGKQWAVCVDCVWECLKTTVMKAMCR